MPRRPVFLLVMALVTLTAVPGALAHTEVQEATPGPGDEVTGSVDEIVLVFLDEIMPGATVEVSGPDGYASQRQPVLDGRTLRVPLEVASVPGDYVVRYSFTAMDGDHQSEGYRFRIVEDDDRIATGAALALGGLIAAAVVAVVRGRLVRRT